MLIKRLYSIIYFTWGRIGQILIYRFVKIFLNIFYPFYCAIYSYPTNSKKAERVIVSITSYPPRIDKIWMVIESILRQTYRPYKIILWLAENQFSGFNSLPKNLLELKKYGLEIRFCKDLLSHKKYFYAMQEFSQFDLITIDDDTFYPENLIENLVECSKKNPRMICCYLAHQMTFVNGELQKYEDWKSGDQVDQGPSDMLVPIGCEGVYYPSNILDSEVFDSEKFLQICPYADDLWLKAMSAIKDVKVVMVKSKCIPFVNILYWKIKKNSTLSSINNEFKMNDYQMRQILNEYSMLREKWRLKSFEFDSDRFIVNTFNQDSK